VRSVEVLHSFNGADGSFPVSPLLAVGSELWGTTQSGGAFGFGSIFRVSRSGTFTTLYSFLGLGDGAEPQRLVLGPDGAVYGTTRQVYDSGSHATIPIPGTLFRIAPSGALVTLFVFRALESGYDPGDLTVTTDGAMYGYTATGGLGGRGTVFRASTDGSLTIVHTFGVEESSPNSALVQGADGNLWGTNGGGYIFRLTPDGELAVVPNAPLAGAFRLIAGIDGTMYGTLARFMVGAFETWMFRLATSGAVTQGADRFIDLSFAFCTQAADGTLFGTLEGGLVSVTPDLAYSFFATPPGFALTLIDGRDGYLYGTSSGGVNNDGTVFRVAPNVGHAPRVGDFDGDGKSDLTVYRPSDSTWYTIGSLGSTQTFLWGAPDEIPVPADYAGDGLSDHAVFRPSDGSWSITLFGGKFLGVRWGGSGDLPVPADYDGDGKADVAVFRPSNGTWYIISSATGVGWSVKFGASGDVPVPGDYDGDGLTDVAVFRPSTGMWYIGRSQTRDTVAQLWGGVGDIPVAGDYDGDGNTDIALFRPTTGQWFIILSSSGTSRVEAFGTDGDIPVPGDYDGDGITDVGVFRPSTGMWYIARSGSPGTMVSTRWGGAGDVPFPGH
jgi:uncharacterized repeat protein (TIGR03803 family)